MKTSLIMATALMTAALGFAQAEPGAAEIPIEETPAEKATTAEAEITQEDFPAPTAAAVKHLNLKDEVYKFLRENGLKEGASRKNGNFRYITVGYGNIDVPIDDPEFTDARIDAFEKALMEAKKNLATTMEASVRTAAAMSRGYKRPANAPKECEEIAKELKAMPDDSAPGKAMKLLHLKLDKALKDDGYDIQAEKKKVAAHNDDVKRRMKNAEKKLTKEVFENFSQDISALANCFVSGLQVRHTIEGVTKGKGRIAAITIWTPKTALVASAMINGEKLPPLAAKRSIDEQLPENSAEFIGRFGAQQMIDENGELVVVSYGQAISEDDDDLTLNALATDEAELKAIANIRNLAGEMVLANGAYKKATSKNRYVGVNNFDYRKEKSISTAIKTEAEALPINGIAKLREWEAEHPATGRMIYGVVYTWSPSFASFARGMKKTIEKDAQKAAIGKREIVDEEIPDELKVKTRPQSRPSKKSNRNLRNVRDYNLQTTPYGDDDAF